jgi:hypothetical protein
LGPEALGARRVSDALDSKTVLALQCSAVLVDVCGLALDPFLQVKYVVHVLRKVGIVLYGRRLAEAPQDPCSCYVR